MCTNGAIFSTAPKLTERSVSLMASLPWPIAPQMLLPDRQSADLAAAARCGNPAAVNELPLEFIDDTLGRRIGGAVRKASIPNGSSTK